MTGDDTGRPLESSATNRPGQLLLKYQFVKIECCSDDIANKSIVVGFGDKCVRLISQSILNQFS